jgi:hypothetical protein
LGILPGLLEEVDKGTSPEKFTLKKLLKPPKYLQNVLDIPANEPKDEMLVLCRPISKTPNRPEYVEIGFEQGIPVKLNGKKTDGVKLIETLSLSKTGSAAPCLVSSSI